MMTRMISKTGVVAAVGFAFGVAPQLLAQTTVKPSPMYSVGCEWVKPGMGPAHDQHEERWARAAEAVKGFASALAVQSTTGPAVSCWFTGLASYDQLGKNNDAYAADPAYTKAIPSLIGGDAQFISDNRTSIAVLRPDLSAGDMPNVLSRRLMNWGEWRIRFGMDAQFIAALKTFRAAAARAGVKTEFRTYEVVQGAPATTYWIISSESAMAGFDAVMANDPKIGAAYTPEDLKVFEAATASIMSMVSNIWAYSSAQSQLTPEQRATDPFWKLKTAPK